MHVLPLAGREWKRWKALAEQIPDEELRKQALASLHRKRFHAEGGCVYAAAMPSSENVLVPLIVALQTISDYLDNLCDRSTSQSAEDFTQLHYAIEDAVVVGAPLRDYYAHRREWNDGGYLTALVTTCQQQIGRLPRYGDVAEFVHTYVIRYNELQTYKHVDPRDRVSLLERWFHDRCEHPTWLATLPWWEYAAAAGSTLAVFALFLEAANDQPDVDGERVRLLDEAYFPWVCGLHILLDYLIDQEEDLAGGDLNFVAQYKEPSEGFVRIALFADQARLAVKKLPGAPFHQLVIAGLLGMYLSDRKITRGTRAAFANQMVFEHGSAARLFRMASRTYRWIVRHD